jgi:exopolysaccharide biosynthesis polyprenyl glycosylphosphotransferase
MSQFAAPKQAGKLLRLPFWLRLEISERRLLLRSVDLLLIGISIVGSLLVWSFWGQRPLTFDVLRDQVLWMVLLFLGWPLWLALSDMYNVRMSARLAGSVARVLIGALVVTFVYLILFFISSRAPAYDIFPRIISGLSASPPLRLVPVGAIGISTCLLLLWRASYIWLLSGPLTWRRALILGAGGAGTTLCTTLLQLHDTHYHIIGFVDDDPAKQHTQISGIPVLGGHNALVRLIREHSADEIVVAISDDMRGTLFQTLMDCHERGIAITPMPLLYERLTGKIAVEHIGSQWYAALPIQKHAARTAFQFVKRLIDLAVGLLLGIVFVLLCPLIALAIRLDSPGPLFYRQERVGLHGRRFYVTKFRSMAPDAERAGEARWADRDDQRITRVGRVLRRMRLDELPQALNVLKGEMSVVGPRPERPQFIEQLQCQIPFYRTRLAARPGLTGWAQINYGYGNTVEDALVKLQYDLYYLKHQSPWFDLKIILRTIGVVLRMQGQ